MHKPRALARKVATLQVGRREVQPGELQAVQQVVQPAEALRVVRLVPVRQVQRVQQVQRALLVRLLVRSPGLLALSAWSVR